MLRLFISSSLLFATGLGAVANDRITLKNKDLFFGKVIALKDGLIEVSTPHSDTPLQVLNKDLLHLNFADADTGELEKNPQELSLKNGDSFPGEVIALSETHLTFQTWFAGALEIPRAQIESVLFGVTPQPTLYRGPKGIDSWTQSNENKWKFTNGVLRSSGDGFIGKKLPIPENFIFSTTVAWTNGPNMKIHLCTDEESPNDKTTGNGYLIYVNTSEIQVQRVMAPKTPGSKDVYKTLITHTAKLRDLPSKQVQVELRVNRKSGSLQLYLDGRKLEQGIDPFEPPTGSCLLFEDMRLEGSDTRIRDLHIQEWDTTTQRLQLEPRAADNTDTLSVGDGDRFSGEILSFDPEKPEKPFTIKTALSPAPIAIPQEDCAVMYFAKGQDHPPSKGQYQLDLRTGGGLTLSGIQLGKEKLIASHPWLGQLEIDRRIMSSISKSK